MRPPDPLEAMRTRRCRGAAQAEKPRDAAGEVAKPEDGPSQQAARTSTVLAYNLVFDNEPQQKAWYDFVTLLKARYPDEETIAARVLKFIHDESMGLAPARQRGSRP